MLLTGTSFSAIISPSWSFLMTQHTSLYRSENGARRSIISGGDVPKCILQCDPEYVSDSKRTTFNEFDSHSRLDDFVVKTCRMDYISRLGKRGFGEHRLLIIPSLKRCFKGLHFKGPIWKIVIGIKSSGILLLVSSVNYHSDLCWVVTISCRVHCRGSAGRRSDERIVYKSKLLTVTTIVSYAHHWISESVIKSATSSVGMFWLGLGETVLETGSSSWVLICLGYSPI